MKSSTGLRKTIVMISMILSTAITAESALDNEDKQKKALKEIIKYVLTEDNIKNALLEYDKFIDGKNEDYLGGESKQMGFRKKLKEILNANIKKKDEVKNDINFIIIDYDAAVKKYKDGARSKLLEEKRKVLARVETELVTKYSLKESAKGDAKTARYIINEIKKYLEGALLKDELDKAKGLDEKEPEEKNKVREKNLKKQIDNTIGAIDKILGQYALPGDTDNVKSVTDAIIKIIEQEIKKEEITTPEWYSKYWFLHWGVAVLNPYKLTLIGKDMLSKAATSEHDGTKGYPAEYEGYYKLDNKSETDTNWYIEALFRHRKAWIQGEDSTHAQGARNVWDWWTKDGPKNLCRRKLSHPFFDYEVKMGVVGTGDKKTGSAIAGSGNAYGEFSIGLPLYSDIHSDNNVSHSFNAEYLFGFVTDRGTQKVHTNEAYGITLVWGIPIAKVTKEVTSKKTLAVKDINSEKAQKSGLFVSNVTTEWRKIELLIGIYSSRVPIPKFDDNDGINQKLKKVVKFNGGYPAFNNVNATLIRLETHVPWGKDGFFTLSGLFYTGTKDVSPWSLRIGTTIFIDKIVKNLFPED